MPDQKISQLGSLLGADVDDDNDVLAIVDTSSDATAKITRKELFSSVAESTITGTLEVSGALSVGTSGASLIEMLETGGASVIRCDRSAFSDNTGILNINSADGVSAAQITGSGTGTASAKTVMTREKFDFRGDARYIGIDNGTYTGYLTGPRVRLTNQNELTLASTNHPFQIGPDDGPNLAADPNEIQTRDDGAAATLNLNIAGGDVNLGNSTSIVKSNGLFEASEGMKLDGAGFEECTISFQNQSNSVNNIIRCSNGGALFARADEGGLNTKTYQFTELGGDLNATIIRRQDGDARYTQISSDERLKENIVDMDSVGDIVDSLRPVRFIWKNNESYHKHEGLMYGLIAQEVDSVASELSLGSEEAMMGIDALSMLSVLVKEVQSLRTRVAELEAQDEVTP